MREGAGGGDQVREMGGSCANARGLERFANGTNGNNRIQQQTAYCIIYQ